jgi:HTH-type transcriptional regulator/antitoxin HigA
MEALAVLQPLVMGEETNTKDQDDYMEALSILVEAYERRHHAVPEGTPLGALRLLLESHGMSGYDLGKLLGDTTIGSKILKGKRQLSKSHIKKLTEHFGVSADVFI